MFKAGQANPYDEIVAKTTDENLTSENWELILNLCDKVQDEGETGARDVIAAIIKRLAHRNPNVQLYSLTLVESLQKNCGLEVHREISSRAFTQALEKLVTDRTTHDKVRRRALSLIATWTAEFERDPTLGIMEDLYNGLKTKNYKFETPNEPPPPDVDDEIRRKEEEELQRALEMSVHDKGGRNQWAEYSVYSSNGAGGSSGSGYGASSSTPSAGSSSAGPASASSSTYRRDSYQQPSTPTYASGYAPAHTPQTPAAIASVTSAASPYGPAPSTSPPAPASQAIVTRVRALHTFEPSEPGELAFDKGDIIKVVDRGYKDWWRGQLKGRTGIFPVNYVEPLPEPTPAELAREAEQEAGVFYQAMNVDRLLTLLRHLDPAKDNLADNEEIQELYRQCMSLRPKIVKLIEKYSQKRADLISMNEGFVKARTIYERMMEDSLARHTQVYDSYRPTSQYPRPESAAPGVQEFGPQAYGWNPSVYNQPGYNAFPAPAAPYTPGQEGGYPPQQQQQPPPQQQQQQLPPQQQPYPDANAYQGQQQQANAYPQPYANVSRGSSFAPSVQSEAAPYAAIPDQQPAAAPQPQPQVQAQSAPQPEPQRQQSGPAPQAGPPFVYDPSQTYADPNVQAWAQYYAQGGKDPTGSVYFISIPGVKEPPPPTPASAAQAQDEPLYNPYGPNEPAAYGHPNGSQTSLGSGAAHSASPYSSAAESVTDLNGSGAGEAQGQGQSQLTRYPSVASTVVPHGVQSMQSPHTPSSAHTFGQQQDLHGVAAGSPLAQSFHQPGDGASPEGLSPHEAYPNPYGGGYAPAPLPKSPGAGTGPGWPGVVDQFNAMHIQPHAGEGASAPAQ